MAIAITCIFAIIYEKNTNKQLTAVTGKYNRINQPLNIFWMLGMFLPLYLVNSCMYYVGGDYENYVLYYKKIAQGLEQDVDIAYKLINHLVIKLGLDFQWIYFIICFIAYSILLICIRKYTQNIWISYLFFVLYGFFFLLGLNQIRQFVAVVLVCLAYQYVEKRALFKYLIVVLLACSFHFTAVIALPVYFICHKEVKLSFYMVICLVGLPINFTFNQILVFLFSTFLPRYLQSDFVSGTYRLDVPYLTMILITLVIILAYREKLLQKAINVVFINCCCLGGCLAVFYSWLPEFKRFVYYLFIPAIFLIPQIFGIEKRRSTRWILLLLQIGICLLYLKMASGTWKVFPYRSIFSR